MRRMIDGKNIKFVEDMSEVMKYNSSTNTVEVGKNLEVNGDATIQGDLKTYGGLESYGDSSLTFYLDNNNQSKNIAISPMFGDNETIDELAFANTLQDGAETYYAYLDLDKTSHILTDKNIKTVFGQSLYNRNGNGNIGLYRHQLTLSSATNTYVGVIYLLNNTPITSTQLLTTYTNAFNGYMFLAVKVTGPADSQNAIGIGYTNNQWATTYSDVITNVSDTVKPL